ncbi:hypothetical protein E1B28_001745 [Marasmius oreades]|uniref:Uncharacterized protein n=1 Tax=Marasmius oreades TaxID=181124 RepID=A0A9P7V4D7_9AGAR|nr:uncharacterized protein E1B28_001745 [Marasmius oreades]KAG7099952.1 hypothetical protein E1B28_001745 [Marasmius oreades]
MRIVRLKDFSVRPSMAGSGRHSGKTGKTQVVPQSLGHSINRKGLLTPAAEVIGGLFGLGEVLKPKPNDSRPPPRGGPPPPPVTSSSIVTPSPAPDPSPITSTSPEERTTTTSVQTTSSTSPASSTSSSTSTRSTSTGTDGNTSVSTTATSSLPSTEPRGRQPQTSPHLSSSSPFSPNAPSSSPSTLSTSPPPPPPPPVGSTSASLSPSAIAGIVVGVVIGMMIIIFLTLFCLRRRRAMKAVSSGLSFEKAYPYPFTSPTAAAGVTRSIGRPISPPSPESIRAFNPSLMVSPGQPPPIRSSSSLRSLRSIGRVLLATRRDPLAPYRATPQESPPSPSKTSVEQGGYGGRSRWSTTAEGDFSLSSANSISISTSEESGSTVRKPLPNPFDDSSSVSAQSSDQSSDLRFRTS